MIHFSGEMRYRKKERNNIYNKADDVHPKTVENYKTEELGVSKISVNL